MHSSSVAARVVTTIVTLLAVPVSLVSLSAGGAPVLMALYQRMPVTEAPASALVWMTAGLALLLVVMLLGIWSAAGLLASGIYTLIFLAAALFPSVTFEISRIMTELLPGRFALDASMGLRYGTFALITAVLPVLGAVLAASRRTSAGGFGPRSIAGLIGAPVLLGAGTILTIIGFATGLTMQLRTLQQTPQLVPSLLLLVGVIVVMVGAALAWTSPFALLIPGIAAAVLTALCLTPIVLETALRMGTFWSVRVFEVADTLNGAVLTGVGPAWTVLFLAFTGAALVVRQQERRREARQ